MKQDTTSDVNKLTIVGKVKRVLRKFEQGKAPYSTTVSTMCGLIATATEEDRRVAMEYVLKDIDEELKELGHKQVQEVRNGKDI